MNDQDKSSIDGGRLAALAVWTRRALLIERIWPPLVFALAVVILFLAVYFFSGLSHIATSFDSRWTVFIAMSIWDHRDTNLDEYPAAMKTRFDEAALFRWTSYGAQDYPD